MIIDFIEPHNLPHFVVWLDWMLYGYPGEFVIAVVVTFLILGFTDEKLSYHKLVYMSLFNFCTVSYVLYGYGVG